MNTGKRCVVCTLPILTNHVIVGFPVIRITGIDKSAMAGEEFLAHADCFAERMSAPKSPILKLNRQVV